MNKKKLAIVGVILLVLAMIGGAIYDVQSANKAREDNKAATTISIEHFNGVTSVQKHPTRMVVLDYSVLDNMIALGVTDNVEIATSTKYIPKYIDISKFNKVTDIGNLKEPNLEAIYNFNPDIIIINGRQLRYYDNLSKIAPTVNTKHDKNSDYVDTLYNNIGIVGRLFDKEIEAFRLCAEINNRISKVNSMKKDKGMILFIVGNKMFAVSKNSMMGGLPYDACKLETVVEESNTTKKTGPYVNEISFEYIRDKNPEYILVVNRDAALRMNSKKNKEFLMSNPLLQDVNAIKNNRVEFVDSEIWYLSGGGYQSTLTMIDEIENIL